MKKIMISLFFAAVTAGALWAQIQADKDVPTPTKEEQGPAGLTPQFFLSAQAMFGAGYNFQTGAKGFRNYGGDDDTWFSFSIAFVDSHYATPKMFTVGSAPEDQWGAKFKFFNYTIRLDSWDADKSEINAGAWLAEISGMNIHIGFFTQAGLLLGSMEHLDTDNHNPISTIYGGGKVLNLGDKDLGKSYYNIDTLIPTVTLYSRSSSGGGVLYAGYELPDFFKVYGTALSEGDVNSNVSNGKNDGLAGALDFAVTPWGTLTGRRTPLTLNVEGSLIGGVGFDAGNPFGFGLKTEVGKWLGGNFVIAPMLAFDGSKHDKNNDTDFYWKFGGGLTFRFSSVRWVSDDWGELNMENYSYRYENNKILKYAYTQLYLAYSDTEDIDMVFKVEEPDGEAGFHDKLGAMLELRLYNLTEKVETKPFSWAAQGRVSYDIDVANMLITPYLRAYLNNDSIFKLRIGAQANIIPRCGFELAYTSANLNSGATGYSNNYDKDTMDKGRIELIVILKSDEDRPKTRKRMDEWNYNKYADGSHLFEPY